MIINPYPKYTDGKLLFEDGRELFREYYELSTDVIRKAEKEVKLITESVQQGNSDYETLIMDCILQKCETENRNGRWYTHNILERENNNYQQLIKEGRALGHAKHPDHSLVEFEDASHRVIKSWWDDNILMGQIEILASPGYFKMGIISCPGDNILDKLRKGVKMGISSRGVGSLQETNGKNVVQEDFELICFDLVSSPSTPGAFLFDVSVNINEDINTNKTSNLYKKPSIITNPLVRNLDEFLK